jgi:hypothetical protein
MGREITSGQGCEPTFFCFGSMSHAAIPEHKSTWCTIILRHRNLRFYVLSEPTVFPVNNVDMLHISHFSSGYTICTCGYAWVKLGSKKNMYIKRCFFSLSGEFITQKCFTHICIGHININFGHFANGF